MRYRGVPEIIFVKTNKLTVNWYYSLTLFSTEKRFLILGENLSEQMAEGAVDAVSTRTLNNRSA